MKPILTALAALAAAPALAHEATGLPHVHPHGSDTLILAALGAAVLVVLVALRLRRR